ncbi:uncharacterized protein LOC129216298 [Uloborus diversus]|uniref:uncharacterized protein LOC129216298 n=1 Tax=Uloborus diversus TaxID=327109 RepID=UPI00240914AD|nr:uncharacterized protein LOC129216298 [Uloborus diversus]
MERVSPIYDILRYLPPFEDGWLPPPFTEPTPLLSPTLEPQRDYSTYSEFKVEISKDKEHVVSESGRQFRENSALNWFYSANSYSSLHHFTIPTLEQKQNSQPTTEKSLLSTSNFPKTTAAAAKLKPLTEVVKSTLQSTDKACTLLPITEKTTTSQIYSEDLFKKDSRREDITTKPSVITVSPNNPFDNNPNSLLKRRQDREHVVSQVPGFRSNHGIFVNTDFVVPSTTPKVNITMPKPDVETKPNVTTRYILLQSGRIVAINVTSAPKVLKDASNNNIPPYYFGSRIRNKKPPAAHNITRNEKSTFQNKTFQPIILTSSDLILNSDKNKNLTSRNKQKPLLRPIISFRDVRLLFTSGNMTNNLKSPSKNATKERLFETLIDVFHPGTTESQYLVITFSSAKKKPKNPPLITKDFSLRSNEQHKNNKSDESSTISFQEEKRIKPQVSNPLRRPDFENRIKPNISTTVTIATIPNRGLSHVNLQAAKRVKSEKLTPGNTGPQPATTSSTTQISPRRSRQHEFHFRNSVSFQTIPPSSFSDRRSLSSSTIPSQPLVHESPTKRSKILKENNLIFSFEPTRRSGRTNLLRNVTVTPQNERNATLRNRINLHRSRPSAPVQNPWWTQVTAPTPSSVPISKPVTNLIEKQFRVSLTTTKPIRDQVPVTSTAQNSARRESRNFRGADFKPEFSSTDPNPSSTTMTKKPFRVYFFEPKRKKSKQVDQSAKESDKETKMLANTNIYESSSRRSRHRQLDNSSNKNPAVSRSPKRLPSTQINSETTSTTPALLPKATSRKPRYIPFIRHQPNVGTKSPQLSQRTTKSTTIRPVTILESSLESESFLDYVHRPFEIRRTG